MPSWLDHLLVFAFAIAWPAWGFFHHGPYRARVRAGIPGARLAGYAETAVTEWLLAALAVCLWIHASRDWSLLGLVGPASGRTWIALATAMGLGGLLLAQSAAVVASEGPQAQARQAIAPIAEVLPADGSDLRGFLALSITAGICEEVLFRGLLPWYLAHWLGFWGGHAAALALFGALHAYLGRAAALRAFLTGAAMAGLYVWSGSLVPSMLLHALVDVAGGLMGYAVLRQRPSGQAAAAG